MTLGYGTRVRTRGEQESEYRTTPQEEMDAVCVLFHSRGEGFRKENDGLRNHSQKACRLLGPWSSEEAAPGSKGTTHVLVRLG